MSKTLVAVLVVIVGLLVVVNLLKTPPPVVATNQSTVPIAKIVTPGETTSSSPPPEVQRPKYDSWTIRTYVDEFGEPTKSRYICNASHIFGTFSNSATTDSDLRVDILINGKADIQFMLYEYASNHPVKSYGSATIYHISVKDLDGKVTSRLEARLSGDRLYLGDRSIRVHDILLKGGEVKFHINGDYGSTYDFVVEATGYKLAYEEFKSTKKKV